MERIGLAASRMSKGNLLLYNVWVVLIASLFSFFVFVITGATIVFALVIISYLGSQVMGFNFEEKWPPILSFCLVVLTGLVLLFNLFAIARNIKLRKD